MADHFGIACFTGLLGEFPLLASTPGLSLALCAVFSLPLAACATAGPEDSRGRGTDEDAGGSGIKPSLPDAGDRPDAFVIDHNDASGGGADGGLLDAGCTAETIDLLVNGNFDDGPGEPWIESSGGGFRLILAQGDADLPFEVVPDSGTFILYLGGYNNAADEIHQDLTLPAGAGGLRLRGVGRIDTDETQASPFDNVFLEIASTAGEVIEELAHFTNEDATGGAFLGFDVPVAGDFAGQTIRVQVRDTGDFSLNTHFFFDTLELEATCSGG